MKSWSLNTDIKQIQGQRKFWFPFYYVSNTTAKDPVLLMAIYLIQDWNIIKAMISLFILQTKKLLKCDWLRPVVFKPNLKYLHVKITASHVLL